MDELEKIMVDALKELKAKGIEIQEPRYTYHGITLSESEVIKALEVHSTHCGSCRECPLNTKHHCSFVLAGVTLQLLTNQVKRIERYKRIITKMYGGR